MHRPFLLCLLWNNSVSLYQLSAEQNILAEQNKGFRVFCWSGDTRIWTGEKGFAVPRLTTRPYRQNDTKKKMAEKFIA
jgi:hypothetical protein